MTTLPFLYWKIILTTRPVFTWLDLRRLSDWTGFRNALKMDHLACFTPAMMALGALHSYVSDALTAAGHKLLLPHPVLTAVLLPLLRVLHVLDPACRRDGSILAEKKWQHMKEAKAMTYSCYQMYARQPTGLSPEFVEYPGLTEPVPGRRVSHAAQPALHILVVHRVPKLWCGVALPAAQVAKWHATTTSRTLAPLLCLR
jgi:hypothetical protein